MKVKKTSRVSRIKPNGEKFSLSDLPLHRFVNLGKQYKDTSIVHTAYVRRPSLGPTCYVQPKVKVSGYCSYSLVYCENSGLIGVVFYSYTKRTKVTPFSIVVSRQVEDASEDLFDPIFTLERLDLLLYSSSCGSVVAVPTSVTGSPLLVPVT